MVPVNPSQTSLLPTAYSPRSPTVALAIARLLLLKHREVVVNLRDDLYHTDPPLLDPACNLHSYVKPITVFERKQGAWGNLYQFCYSMSDEAIAS